MRVTFYGVRGSFPVAHPKVARVGGNTSCVALRADGAPTLIVDGGTGLRRLGAELLEEGLGDGVGQAALLFSHAHWDHIQGFMHFSPFFREGNQVQVFARANHDARLQELFAAPGRRPYASSGIERFRADVSYQALAEGDAFSIGPWQIETVRMNHPGVAIAYRITLGDKSFVYMTDTAPFDYQLLGEGKFHHKEPSVGEEREELERQGAAVERFVQGADLLLYDTFFTAEQYAQNPHWGHSTPDEGIRLARQGGVARFVNFHHHPEAWDDDLEGRTAEYGQRLGGADLEVLLAREGESLEL